MTTEGEKEGVTWRMAKFYCRACGRGLNPNWKFCPACGSSTINKMEVRIDLPAQKEGKK